MDLNAQAQNSDTQTPKPGDLQGTAASIVRDVLESAESATGEAADKVKPVVGKLPQAAQAPLYRAVHAAADAAASMPQAKRSVAGSVAQYARTNPRRALAFAFVTGLLIGRSVL